MNNIGKCLLGTFILKGNKMTESSILQKRFLFLLECYRLPGEGFRNVDQFPFPFYITILTYLSHRNIMTTFHLRHPGMSI